MSGDKLSKMLAILNAISFLSGFAMAADGFGEMSFPLWQVGLTLLVQLISVIWMAQRAFAPALPAQLAAAGSRAAVNAALLTALYTPVQPRRPRRTLRDDIPNTPEIVVVTGELQAEGCYQHDLILKRGDRVTLTARAVGERTMLDPTLSLLDADGYRLAYNDDHDTDDPTLNVLDARITDVPIRYEDTYTVAVETYRGFGNFELTIEVIRKT